MHLHLSGKEYSVEKILFFTAICPTTQVKTEDLIFNENTIVTQSKHTVVYPYDNKYLVLVHSGNIDSTAAMQTVKIMSKIVLKKIAHADDVVQEDNSYTHRTVSDRSPKNRHLRRGDFNQKDDYYGY